MHAAPAPPPPLTPACMTVSPATPSPPADPRAAQFVSATQQTDGAQRHLEQGRQSATTAAQQQAIDRSQVDALHTLRVGLDQIAFPNTMDGDVGDLKWAINQEESAYIHAAGSPTPDNASYLAQINGSVQGTQTASNKVRSDLSLAPTNQCL